MAKGDARRKLGKVVMPRPKGEKKDASINVPAADAKAGGQA